ncbi:uncharacterized protein [Antedon mediterranea]|uniref:uncharacterized protein isoform X1 n=1 Tax=Antedon mediterranea TaxID=105859 RepID=UPI003AF65730
MWLIGNMTTVLNVTHDVKNLGNIAEVFNLNDYQTKAKAQFKPEAKKSADAKGQIKSSENAQVDILNNNPFIRTTTEQSEKEILKNNTVNIVQAHRVITNESLLDINHSQDYRAKSTFTAPTNAAKYNTLKERTMPEEDYHGVISKAELTTYQYKKDRLKNNTVDGNTLHNFINSSNLEHKESTKLGLDIFLAKNFNISISTDDIMSLIYNMTTNVNNDAIDLADYENLYELFLKDYQTSTSISTTKATKPDTPEILRTPGENLNELSLKDYQTSTSISTTEATKHDTLERLKTLGENLDELSLKEHQTSTPISTTKATKPDTLERLRTPGENLDELSLKEHQTSTSISTTKETKPDTLERLRTPGKNLDESSLKDYQTSISISTTEATKPDTMEILRTPGKNLDELSLKQYQTSTWEATKPDTLERLRTPGENRQVVMSTVNLNGQALIQQFETNLLENYTVNTMQTNTEILNSFLNIINSSITKNKHVTNLDLDLFLAKNFSMAASGEKVRNLIDTLTNVLNVTKHGRSKEVGDHTKTKLTIKEFTAVTTNEVQFQSDNRNAEENDSLPYKITASKTSTTQSSDLSDVSSRTLANIDTMKTQLDYNMRGSDDRLSTHSDVLTTAETEPIFTTKTPYKWSEWASWQACSVTCGKGIKVATRECKLYIESLEVKSNLCKGNATKVDECVQSYCPLSKDHQTTASYEYFNSTNTTDWIINEMKKEKREIQVVDVIITIVVVFIALLIIFVTIRIRSIMMMDDKSDIEISRISKFSGKPKGLIKKHAQWLKEFGTSMKSKKQPQTDTTTKNINIDQFLKELDEVESDCSD